MQSTSIVYQSYSMFKNRDSRNLVPGNWSRDGDGGLRVLQTFGSAGAGTEIGGLPVLLRKEFLGCRAGAADSRPQAPESRPVQGFSLFRAASGAVNDYSKGSNQRSCYLTDSVDSLLDGLEGVRV